MGNVPIGIPIDQKVYVWEMKTGKLLLKYSGHNNSVNTVAWSPDGKCIASGGDDRTVQVWDTATRQRLVAYTSHMGAVTSVAWSPDSKRIASASTDKTVQIWEAATGRHFFPLYRPYGSGIIGGLVARR